MAGLKYIKERRKILLDTQVKSKQALKYQTVIKMINLLQRGSGNG